jgi:hypothetical protein
MMDKDKDGDSRCLSFCFSLSSFPFSSFVTVVTRALSLKTIKGEAGTPPRKKERRRISDQRVGQDIEFPSPQLTPTHPFTRDLGSVFSLERLITPTISTSVQGNMSSSSIHWM